MGSSRQFGTDEYTLSSIRANMKFRSFHDFLVLRRPAIMEILSRLASGRFYSRIGFYVNDACLKKLNFFADPRVHLATIDHRNLSTLTLRYLLALLLQQNGF